MAEGLGLPGSKSWLNITTPTLIDDETATSYTPRRIGRVNVIVAGTTAGTINDIGTVTGVLPANNVFTIPNALGSYLVDFPMLVGIVIVPGTGQTVAVSYD